MYVTLFQGQKPGADGTVRMQIDLHEQEEVMHERYRGDIVPRVFEGVGLNDSSAAGI